MKWLCPSPVPGTAVALQGVPNRDRRRCPRPAWTGLELPGVLELSLPMMSSEDPSNPHHSGILQRLQQGNKTPQNLSWQPRCPCRVPGAAPGLCPAEPGAGTPGALSPAGPAAAVAGRAESRAAPASATAQQHFLLPHTQGKQKTPKSC